jgi:hypothetical protein
MRSARGGNPRYATEMRKFNLNRVILPAARAAPW